MKILLVYPNVNYGSAYAFDYNFGLGSISALLKAHHHEVSGMIYAKENSISGLLETIDAFTPQIIGFSISSPQFPLAKELMAKVKSAFRDCLIVAGGIHPDLCPEEVIREESVDIVCVGEGEYPMLELAQALEEGREYNRIKNLWIKNGSETIKNGLRPLIQDLDSLPFFDRELFNNGKAIARFIIASRGCPYSCAYCSSHALRALYGSPEHFVRFRSVASIIVEIKQLMERYCITSLYFHDDIMPLEMEWVRDFCSRYKQEIGLPFDCQVRPNLATKELFTLLRGAGCQAVYMGIEHGNEHLRRTILRRTISQGEIIRAFAFAKEAEFKTFSYNLIGLPGETKETIWETIRLNRTVKPDGVQATILYPFPKTFLYDYCAEKNILPEQWDTNIFGATAIRLATITKRQLRFYQRFFAFLVYYKTNPLKAVLELPEDNILRRVLVLLSKAASFLRIKDLLKRLVR